MDQLPEVNVYVAILVGVAVAATVFALVRLAARKSELARSLSFPLYVAAIAAGFRAFTVFETPAVQQIAPTLDKALAATFAFLVAVILIRVVGLVFFDVYLYSGRGLRLPPLLPKVAIGSAYLIAAILLVRIFWPEAQMGALVATSAVTSLVLGLALQPILGNFFAGLVISLERPFRINDWIKVGDTEGRVVEITWRTTHLRTRDNDNLVIPNSQIANQELINYFYPHPLHLERIEVGAHYKTPPYRVKQAILDAVSEVSSVLEKPSPEVFLLDFADSAITYEARVWIEDIAHKPRIANQVRSQIWEKFHRRGITIPFPIRTLELEPAANRLELSRARSKRAPELSEKAYPARLFVAKGPDSGKTFKLTGAEIKLGRSGECDFVLSEPRASKQHLQISWQADVGYRLTDMESRNGTMVNEQLADQHTLRHLDRIQIGDTVIAFEARHGR